MRHIGEIMTTEFFNDSFKTKTGMTVQVRPIRSDDAPALVDIFEHLGPESRYNRFLQPVENVSIDRIWAEAENIAHLVTTGSYGLIAFADLPQHAGAPVGAARYVKIDSTQAELAISVRDDLHGQGIGGNLLRLLISHAVTEGIEQLVGTVQNSNTALWAILKKSGFRLESQLEGNASLITLHIRQSSDRYEECSDTAADFLPEPQIIR